LRPTGDPVTSIELFSIRSTLAITQLKVPGKFPRDERLRCDYVTLHCTICDVDTQGTRGFIRSGSSDCAHSVGSKFIDETAKG
jgi:hypothetical protein